MTDFDKRALRSAFGAFMTGVTVVTVKDAEGTPLGFTANSFTSVSLDPPLVLVCLANSSSNYDAFTSAEGFAVNVLAETQKDVSNTFARPSDDRFAQVSWGAGPNGAPILADVSAWFDCTMHQVIPAGDHAILIGEVKAFDTDPAPGLGYARGAYVTPAAEAEALDPQTGIMVSVLIRQGSTVLLMDRKDGSLTIPEASVGSRGVTDTVAGLLEMTGLNAEAGFIYAVYEDSLRHCQHITFLCEAEPGTPKVGCFVEASASTLMDVSDPAMATMLERFAAETQIGNFGVYYGNEQSGEVRQAIKGGQGR